MKAAWQIRLIGIMVMSSLLAGCEQEPPELRPRKPEIEAFVADPNVIAGGREATLRWITTYAESVRVLDEDGNALDIGGASPANGSVTVRPEASTKYRLIAKGKGPEEVSAETELEVIPDAETRAELWLEPDVITIGETAVLRWKTEYANHVVMKRNGSTFFSSGGELSGSRQVDTHDTTTYELTADGPLGVAVATAKLSVKPAIELFESTSTIPLLPGQEATLAWRTRGADTLVISNSDGDEVPIRREMIANGTTRAPVGQDGIFRLTAKRAGVEETKDVQVNLVGPPTILKLELNPPAITKGTPPKDIEVSWSVRDVQSIELESSTQGLIPLGDRKPNADRIVVSNVSPRTEFTLRATNALDFSEESVTLVEVPLPVVEEFRVVPSRITPEEGFHLVWDTKDATSVEIYRGQEPPPQGIKVPVLPDEVSGDFPHDPYPTATRFHIWAYNLARDKVEGSVTVFTGSPNALASEHEPTVTVDRDQVAPGDDIVFRWDNDGGTKMTITVGGEIEFQTTDVFEIDEGETTLTAPMVEGDVTYEVTVSNARGSHKTVIPVTISSGS